MTMPPANQDTIASLRARAVDVPLAQPITTASGSVTSAPLVLIDLQTAGGISGRSYLFAYTKIALAALARFVADIAPLVEGAPLAPLELAAKLQGSFRLLGMQGLCAMAAAAIDMAAWDALARAAGMPLCRLLGAAPRAVPAYDSRGVCTVDAAKAMAGEARSAGFRALKFKIGAGDAADDLKFVQHLRDYLGADIELMVDYNQSLGPVEGLRRGRDLDTLGLLWIEEPCRAEDDRGHAFLARSLDTPIQLGENWWGPQECARSLAADACDEVMLDVMKIGGVSGWLAASAHAASSSRRVSSHIFPEISAHLLCATPGARYLEWLDVASAVLEDPIAPANGAITPREEPGTGIHWNEAAITRYAL